ncbi:MAG: Amt family ammonium transporter [Verrucomicrobiales bacterium]|jgi:Amt family ammonium transporter
MKLTNHLRKHLGLLAVLLTTFLISANYSPAQDLSSEDYAVTAELLEDGEAADAPGQKIYKYLQLGGDKSALTPEQLLAAEGYYDRYMDAPFFGLSNLWVLLCAFLVFVMHLGFSTLESGLTQSKNTVNILFKNVFIISSGLILYWLWGFNAMYPGDGWAIGDIFAMGSPWDGGPADNGDLTYGGTGLLMTGWTDFLFQAMFAATAATIVSGAVAERVKLGSFMIFAVLLVGIAYPITGGWKWGAGWLDDMGFYDFAGSSVVHAFGGFAALACVLVLGPRKGKFTKGGIKPILGSSMPLATIGVFLLWLGWFGFNGGSVLNATPSTISYVCVTTALAAAAGALASIAFSWIVLKKPDLSMALNGVLAGLVGITAGADSVGVFPSIFIGAIAGALVVFAITFFDKIKIDDPVGAISVHGVCGIWGTLAVGLPFFQLEGVEVNLVTQLIGTLSIGAFAFVFSFVVFTILKVTIGVRVDAETEANGLDIEEHGAPAYSHMPMS